MRDFALTVRNSDRGGSPRHRVEEEVAPQVGFDWLVYIHGFGLSKSDAEGQWRTLRAALALDGCTDRLQAGPFFWPSDHFGSKRPTAYPRAGNEAERAGRALGEYFSSRAPNPTIFIGHSLGALVAIEGAARMRTRGHPLRGLILLGAAVENHQLLQLGQYGPDRLADSEAVGYSPIDSILRDWFPRGQRARALFDLHSDAIGLSGEPKDREWQARDSRSNDHSYWKLPVSALLTNSVLSASANYVAATWGPPCWHGGTAAYKPGRWSS